MSLWLAVVPYALSLAAGFALALLWLGSQAKQREQALTQKCERLLGQVEQWQGLYNSMHDLARDTLGPWTPQRVQPPVRASLDAERESVYF